MAGSKYEAAMFAQLEHARYHNRAYAGAVTGRLQGKSAITNDIMRWYATEGGGVPKRPLLVQVRGVYVEWSTTGEVRTVSTEHK